MDTEKQKTLGGSFSLFGKGLHTGLNLTVTFNPAPDNTGYRIQRIDLEGQPTIEAIAENVGNTERGTVLQQGEARVSTVEHGMSALYAMGIDNCLIKLSRCCAPIPGDEIIGFITRGHGVSVHKRDCTNVPADITNCEEPNRWLSARWQSGTETKEFKASLAVECESRVAMMADIANVLADMRVMINAVNTRDAKNGNTLIYLTITVKSTDFLNTVISRLKGINGVENVTRSKN